MIRAVLLVGLVACYSPSYRDCEITCASGSCPAGFNCEQGACRAPGFSGPCGQLNGDVMPADAEIDGNPTLDSDGDGVNDSIDNCRTIANPQQHNEDGDTLGDVCDPCPPYATYIVGGQQMDANVDGDGDGVGNGCDPNPMMFGDRILLFDGLNQQMPATASGPSAPMFGNGAVKFVAQNNTWGAVGFPVAYDTAKRQVVRAAVRIFQVFPEPAHGGGVVMQYDGASRGAACLFATDTAGTGTIDLLEVNNSSPILVHSTDVTAGPLQDVSGTRRSGSNFECALFPGPILGTGPVNVAVMPNTRAGIYARAVDAEYYWVLVVEH